ncbi:HAD hydrolase subfamily IA REG-2-like protein [Multifurca ochricompacta]|uniref:HAD hydrolase subfamily IA REG-2-like protein n=1 Tax=Multifurca ochricompacta TaxID=376703 RepID=A0AAD4M8R9_9AGAM|nr:HAD hydrolase subfamily IA REG-2-like protein [Multifurca ochricompacta]
MIRLVTFDALHTLIAPRKPIHVQYSEVFSSYLGALPPDAVSRSFKLALKQLQVEKPLYSAGATGWWSEVIFRTAMGAGADARAVEKHIDTIVPVLMKRFSSREGYRLFDDTLETLRKLQEMGVQTGLITNSDARIAAVLEDLGIWEYLSPVLISETERVEKPSLSIFLAACARGRALPSETLHVGDDFRDDYIGADNAGLHALLLRRTGSKGGGEQKGIEKMDPGAIKSLNIVNELYDVVAWIERRNADM